MKKLLTALLFLIFAAGCKKDNKTAPVDPPLVPISIAGETLTSQAEVDAFAEKYKGNSLTINGDLIISGATNPNMDISSLKGLSNITTINGALTIIYCPKVTDLSPFANITYAGSVFFSGVGATSVTMDKLQSTGGLQLNDEQTSISFKSLRSVTGSLNLLTKNLTEADFSALTEISGKLSIWGTSLSNLNGFNKLSTVGALLLLNNPSLENLQGLNHLTKLTSPAVVNASTTPVLYYRLNGIFIQNNAKLTSLAGLENISDVPVIYLSNNALLTDFCPMKAQIKALSALPNFNFTAKPIFGNGATIKISQPVATLTGNGGVTSTADAMAIVNACN
ncbi:receptor L domain-containing protein [Mucilaginibacter pedocola]|uniref:Receptor L-domain domain-containing protein n=1 Tax=Mucilaginibacter pedocola TaxID=1792845 RepID=A0A1S9PGG9_9SPHI|nr:hypothetical protein [Mucilaginibacter pedocola]OOQ59648.1 hypothetical protein BC343_05655 [Mucilaginibacter pedocola]